jgi:hypothetical protein
LLGRVAELSMRGFMAMALRAPGNFHDFFQTNA